MIYRKEIEAQIRANSANKVKEVSAGVYEVRGRASMDTVLKGMTLKEAGEMLVAEFEKAALEFNVPVKNIKFAKQRFSPGAILTATRLETAEEIEARIQQNTDREVSRLRKIQADKTAAAYNKRKQIKELEAELEKLKK